MPEYKGMSPTKLWARYEGLYFGVVRLLLAASIIALGLASCSIEDDDLLVVDDPISDHSFTNDQPCALPCWHNIELNQSAETDVMEVLHNSVFVDQSSIRVIVVPREIHGIDEKTILWSCVHPRYQPCGVIELRNNKLAEIQFSIGYPLPVQEVVQRLGAPTYWHVGQFGYNDVPSFGSSLRLTWLDKGIEVEHENLKDHQLYETVKAGKPIPSQVRVTRITYTTFGFPAEWGYVLPAPPWPGLSER